VLTPGVVGEDLTKFFSASQISTAIDGSVSVESNDQAEVAYCRLTEARFDQAPVVDQGRPMGWVATIDLKRFQTVRPAMRSLDTCLMVSAESSIPGILQLIYEHKFLFTVGRQGISGFIVSSDMDRHAVRSYFYLLISGIEMLLAEIVKSATPEEQIVTCIRSNEKKRYDKARGAGQESSPVEYLYLKELIELFNRTSYAQNPELWNERLASYLLKIKSFRNTVMHATSSIAATTENLELASSMPIWATDVSERLRHIFTSPYFNDQDSTEGRGVSAIN
jgi:hypothetical protein